MTTSVGSIRWARRWAWPLCLVGSVILQPSWAQAPAKGAAGLTAGLAVLDRFAGTWEVTVTTRRPKASVATHAFAYAWVLNRRWLHGETAVKPDRTQDFTMFTYDPQTGHYPLWVFQSTGPALHLPRGMWDESTKTMTWKSVPTDPVSYAIACTFDSPVSERCTTLVKNWAGMVMLEQDSVSVRTRKP